MVDSFDISLLPNVLELQPKAHLMTGFGVAFLILVWTSISLRVYVRMFMIRAFGWDDAILLMSAVSLRVYRLRTFIILTKCRSHSPRSAHVY